MRMLTDEQFAVVESKEEALGVLAFAGTGKTTTLRAYAEARPHQRILYLAFNKAVQNEAKSKFSSNVECLTTHALAYRHVGRRFQHKLAQSVRPDVVASALGLDSNAKDRNLVAKASADILNQFVTSPHASFEAFAHSFHRKISNKYLEHAQRLWTLMIDANDPKMPMLHDGYLKLFQLQAPRLEYDVVLFDEAQDANPVTLEIVRHQDAGKVYVGDPHQQIYSFRNAVNAMDSAAIGSRLYLTETFRFGTAIAEVANGILAIKREPKRIKGRGKIGAVETRAFIARGNAAIFERAVKLNENQEGFHVIGGIEGIRLQLLEDIWQLKYGSKAAIQDHYIKSFKDFETLEEQVARTDERDIVAWCGLIKRSLNPLSIPNQIKNLRKDHHETRLITDQILTTAHKSKGLEFDSVEIATDFPSAELIEELERGSRTQNYPNDWHWGPGQCPTLWESGTFRPVIAIPNEEVNLRYVAATRARQSLVPMKGMPPFASQHDWIKKNPTFLWVESTSVLPRLSPQVETAPYDLEEKIVRWTSSYRWRKKPIKPSTLENLILINQAQKPGFSWREISDKAEQASRDESGVVQFFLLAHREYGWLHFQRSVLEFLTQAGFLEKSLK